MGIFSLGLRDREYDVVDKSEHILNQFDYKNLDGLFFPGHDYTRNLQEYAMQQDEIINSLQLEVDELQSKLAGSEGRVLQEVAATWAGKWTQAQIQYGEAERNARLMYADLEVENRQLTLEIEYLQRENEALKDQLAAADQARDKRSQYREQGRGPDGRFKASSVPAGERQREAHWMKQQGYSTGQIARKLGVSYDTVKRYQRAYTSGSSPSKVEYLEAEEKMYTDSGYAE